MASRMLVAPRDTSGQNTSMRVLTRTGSSTVEGDARGRIANRSLLDGCIIRWGRLGFTDIFHKNVARRGILGKLFVLLFGTPHLGSFANGIYLNRVLQKWSFDRVLDAGCGDGTFAFYVASHHPRTQVTGIDIGEQGLHGSEDTLDVAKRIQETLQLPNLRFQRADLRELSVRDAFDFVYSFDVLEHIAENDDVLKNIYRALDRRGMLLLRIPTKQQKRILSRAFTAEHERWAAVEHVGQHHDMQSLLRSLRSMGFRIKLAEYTMGFWGRLSFEGAEAFKYYGLPEVLQFAFLPFLKLCRWIDTIPKYTDGDGLLVLCEK
jgi:2-polyprenyl-3-methyl-5-hydroxy-6-metoxy-1,4-benzoquinol methylase